jgi:hypothetical protein
VSKKNFAIFAICAVWFVACASLNQFGSPKPCLENKPQNIAGLKIEGARTRANVIHNMWPIACRAQEIYQERLKDNPKLKGMIELKLYVEFNGEIGPFSIGRNTLQDPAIENEILTMIQFMDFDPFGPQNSEADILFPIHFKP